MQCIFYMQQVFQQQINYNLHKKIYNQGSGTNLCPCTATQRVPNKDPFIIQSASVQLHLESHASFQNRCHQGTSAQEIFPTSVGSQNFGSHYQCPLAVFVLDNVEDGSHVFRGPDCSNWGRSRSLQDWDHTFDSGTTVVESVRKDTRHENTL